MRKKTEKNNKLKIGILVDSLNIPAWIQLIMKNINVSEHSDFQPAKIQAF